MAPELVDPADWPRVAALFDEALDLDEADRTAWSQALCQREPRLAEPVLRLLAARGLQGTDDWLARGPRLDDQLLGPTAVASPHAAGDDIGRFRLLRHVARGGMGEVWQAQAVDGPDDAPVALKLPLLHRAGSMVAARFEREARLLATLEHPNIARLLQAGCADDGTPFLALEWVDGQPLLAWCDTQRLSRAARLQLFEQVLAAVAYAHARLVLHRDLKPANILVDRQGQVKLLDFGIAKLMSDDAQVDATELTHAAGRVMTPSHAAPEQVRGQTLTPATDVYALGVLLFELLSGQRPYRTRFDSVAQLEQAIDGGDVRRLGELDRTLRGDLDAIVAKALQRDPLQRYATAEALADDLRRHRSGLPVLARPDTVAYSVGRFVRRHRALSLGAAGVLLSLALGLAGTLLQARRAHHERDLALAASRRALATQQFVFDLLGDAARAGQPLSTAELMRRAEQVARRTLADRPDELAGVLSMVALDETTQHDAARTRTLIDEAADLARDPALRAHLQCQAQALAGLSRQPDVDLQRLRDRVADPALDGSARTACQLALSQLLIQNGNLAEAGQQVQAAWSELSERPEAWRDRLRALSMQTFLRADGRAAGLDALIEPTLRELERQGRSRNDGVLGLYNTWGTMAMASGEPAKAVARYGRVVEVLQAEHPQGRLPGYHLDLLARAQAAQGDLSAAAALLDRSLALSSGDSPERFRALCLRAHVDALRGQHAQADRGFAQAAAITDRGEPMRRNANPVCIAARAEAHVLAGRPGDALALLQTLAVPSLPGPSRLAAQLVQAEAELGLGQKPAAALTAQAAEQLARQLQADNRWSWRVGQALMLRALAAPEGPTSPAAQALIAEARQHLEATVLPTQRWRRVAETTAPTGLVPAAAAAASRTAAGP